VNLRTLTLLLAVADFGAFSGNSQEARMSTGGRRNTESQSVYTRQASILRKNLTDWDAILRNPKGEDWSRMLGRLNAALNQSSNMDKCVEDVSRQIVQGKKSFPQECFDC
jgi:hypothetical protein